MAQTVTPQQRQFYLDSSIRTWWCKVAYFSTFLISVKSVSDSTIRGGRACRASGSNMGFQSGCRHWIEWSGQVSWWVAGCVFKTVHFGHWNVINVHLSQSAGNHENSQWVFICGWMMKFPTSDWAGFCCVQMPRCAFWPQLFPERLAIIFQGNQGYATFFMEQRDGMSLAETKQLQFLQISRDGKPS